MDLGRYQLGEIVPLSVWCRSAVLTPTEPAQAPVATIMSSTAQVASIRLPIQDRYGSTAFFQYPLQLDGRFATGDYSVVVQYTIGGVPLADVLTFTVVGGGNFDGAALSMFYYRRPGANFLLTAHDSGRLIRKRNPRA